MTATPKPAALFRPAAKTNTKLRALLSGPSGSGKTWSALSIATQLSATLGGKIAVVDSEAGSAEKYAEAFAFDVVDLLETFGDASIVSFVSAIDAAAAGGYRYLILDSISHEWGDALSKKEAAEAASNSKNGYFAWRGVTPLHDQFVRSCLQYPGHLIACARSKTAYLTEAEDGKKIQPKKIGLAPIARPDTEYEFDLWVELLTRGRDQVATVAKSRYSPLPVGSEYVNIAQKPGDDFVGRLVAGLTDTKTGDEKRIGTGAASPFLGALHWAIALPPVTENNRADIGRQYRERVAAFLVQGFEIPEGPAQAKVDALVAWLKAQHTAFVLRAKSGKPDDDFAPEPQGQDSSFGTDPA